MRLLKMLFLLLPPSLLPAAQIVSGSITWTTLRGPNLGLVNLQTADTSITGAIGLQVHSGYITDPFSNSFNGSVVVDPSGSICGGGLSFSGYSFVQACGSPFLSLISGNIDAGTFLYSGGPVTVRVPFTMNLEIESFMIGPGPHDFLFSGSGTATLTGHSVQPPDLKTAFIVDGYVLNFVNVPEPTPAELVLLTLAAFAIASARRGTAQ